MVLPCHNHAVLAGLAQVEPKFTTGFPTWSNSSRALLRQCSLQDYCLLAPPRPSTVPLGPLAMPPTSSLPNQPTLNPMLAGLARDHTNVRFSTRCPCI
ncbi:hypothetical protein Nepgr_015710 [Nepenthes gracilis]|uniref:Uncharacterized protein n=1 Tax=Nepenthes gracilis TaxID=150966 RepID=A0AAD3SNG3_NEPGR|nr:hypothetical protein Nepgr_015710 [Nepenthes gracilis]